jgi:hypothetical protein
MFKNLFATKKQPESTGYVPKTSVMTTVNNAKLQAYAEVGITDVDSAKEADTLIGQGMKLGAATTIVVLPIAIAAAAVETIKTNAGVKASKTLTRNGEFNAAYAAAFASAEAQTIYDEAYNRMKFEKNGNVRKNFKHNHAHMSALRQRVDYAKKVATLMAKNTK